MKTLRRVFLKDLSEKHCATVWTDVTCRLVLQAPTDVCSCADASTKAVQTFGTSTCRLTAAEMCFVSGLNVLRWRNMLLWWKPILHWHRRMVCRFARCDHSSGNARHVLKNSESAAICVPLLEFEWWEDEVGYKNGMRNCRIKLRQAATPLLAPPSKPAAAARRAARVPMGQKKDETDVAEAGRDVSDASVSGKK